MKKSFESAFPVKQKFSRSSTSNWIIKQKVIFWHGMPPFCSHPAWTDHFQCHASSSMVTSHGKFIVHVTADGRTTFAHATAGRDATWFVFKVTKTCLFSMVTQLPITDSWEGAYIHTYVLTDEHFLLWKNNIIIEQNLDNPKTSCTLRAKNITNLARGRSIRPKPLNFRLSTVVPLPTELSNSNPGEWRTAVLCLPASVHWTKHFLNSGRLKGKFLISAHWM